jgi:hypothetical protein
MCTVDIFPFAVKWDSRFNRVIPLFDNVHTCRNYDKIKSWMLPRSGMKHSLPPIGHPWPDMESPDSE